MAWCYHLPTTPIEQLTLSGVAQFQLPQRWVAGDQTEISPRYVEYSLGMSANALVVSATAFSDQGQLANLKLKRVDNSRFIEGLWNTDVAELFLVSPSGNYQEFNFSFSGDWWSQGFSSYRLPDDKFTPPNLKAISVAEFEVAKRVEAIIPLAELYVKIETIDDLLPQISAIVGQKPRRYFSSTPHSSPAPDFHKLELVTKALIP